MKVPRDGYWHCRILLTRPEGWELNALDNSFEEIIANVVFPYRRDREFVFEGRRVKNRDAVKIINIVHTEQHSLIYGVNCACVAPKAAATTANDILAYKNGKDFTQYLLYSPELNIEFKKSRIEKAPPSRLWAEPTELQVQAANAKISQEFTRIYELQYVFDAFRLGLEEIEEVEGRRMKEAQDALDSLSKNSTPQQVCTALNKVGRILHNSCASQPQLPKGVKPPEVCENLVHLKNVYNAVALHLGVPLY